MKKTWKMVSFISLTEVQQERLRVEFPMIDVIVLDEMTEKELAGFDWDTVEITLGWDPVFGDKMLQSSNSSLRWIQSRSAGVDYLDFSLVAQKGILVTNASGIHGIPIAEHILGVLFAKYRSIQQAVKDQAKGLWIVENKPLDSLMHKKMLILGTGHIGRTVAQTVQSLGVATYGINTTGHAEVGFEECYATKEVGNVVGEMDIIVNILPFTPQTHHFYDEAFFAQVKTGADFVNVGRGPSVKTSALIEAIENGKIGFAALDVFETEPLPSDSPLWQLENVLITPHIAGHHPHYMEDLLVIFKKNITCFLETKQVCQNIVDVTRGY